MAMPWGWGVGWTAQGRGPDGFHGGLRVGGDIGEPDEPLALLIARHLPEGEFVPHVVEEGVIEAKHIPQSAVRDSPVALQ